MVLVLAVPAYADTGSSHRGKTGGGNGGLGQGMGTNGGQLRSQSVNGMGARSTGNYDVSVYGTGTGTQFLNDNLNAADTTTRAGYRAQSYSNAPGTAMNGTMNGNGYRTQSYTNNSYRAAAADNDRDWGWLGLFGLIGLAGLFGRNPQRER